VSQAVLVLALLGPPTEEQRAALSAYEHTRQVRLERGPDFTQARRKPAYPGYDGKLALELEAELEAARTRAASLDEATAALLLTRFEQKLLAHPELPQSAWLMAERYRLGAEIAAREGTAAEARDHVRRALVLEGARAAELGVPPNGEPSPPEVGVRIEGLDARDELEIDGRSIDARALGVATGQHHVRVIRSGRLVYAGWVTIGEGASALSLELPAIVACSADDVAGYRIEPERPVAAAGTRCPRWVLAAPSGRGLRFADCFGDRCGPFVSFSGEAERASLPPQPERERPSRLLVNVAIVGAAVLAGTAVVLWQSGAFDEPEPGETRWIYGGTTPAQ